VTKQWTAKWPYIANVVFRTVYNSETVYNIQVMVNKVTFVGARGAIVPPAKRNEGILTSKL